MPSQEILQVIVVPFIQEKSWTYFESQPRTTTELKGLVKESTDMDDREHAFRLYLMEKNYINSITDISGVSLVLVEDLPKVATAGRTSRLEK